MIYLIFILIFLWLLGAVARIGGGLVHLLLIVAAVLFVYDVLKGRNIK